MDNKAIWLSCLIQLYFFGVIEINHQKTAGCDVRTLIYYGLHIKAENNIKKKNASCNNGEFSCFGGDKCIVFVL